MVRPLIDHDAGEAAEAGAARQHQRADDGADSHGAHQDAEAARAAVKDVVGEERHEDEAGHAGEGGGGHEGEHAADGGVVGGVAEAIDQMFEHGDVLLGFGGRQAHRGQAGDHRQKS